jgi:hypothetical protein
MVVLALTGCETAQELDKRAEAYYKPQVGQTTLRFAPGFSILCLVENLHSAPRDAKSRRTPPLIVRARR